MKDSPINKKNSYVVEMQELGGGDLIVRGGMGRVGEVTLDIVDKLDAVGDAVSGRKVLKMSYFCDRIQNKWLNWGKNDSRISE